MRSYNPADWYWIVAGSATSVYSSAAAAYAPATDPTFEAWLASGATPTRIATEADLHDVLAAQFPAGLGTLGTVQQRAAAMLDGTTIALTSTSTPALNGTYPVDPAQTANMTAVQAAISAGVGLPGGGSTVAWIDAAGADHAFTAAEFTAFAAVVMNYVYGLVRCAGGKSATLPSPALAIP